MNMLIFVVNLVLQSIAGLVLLRVIFSWLINFEVIPAYHPVVSRLIDFLYQITEPFLAKVRRYVPLFAGMDLSPWIVIVAAEALRRFIVYDVLVPILQS